MNESKKRESQDCFYAGHCELKIKTDKSPKNGFTCFNELAELRGIRRCNYWTGENTEGRLP